MRNAIRYKGLMVSVGMLLFSAFFYASSYMIKDSGIVAIGPAFIPRIVCGGMGLLALIQMVLDLLELRRQKGKPADPAEKREINVAMVLATVALFALYIFCLSILGFIISTILYLFVQMFLLSVGKKQNLVLFAVISIALTVLIYFFFRQVMYLMLPAGILPF